MTLRLTVASVITIYNYYHGGDGDEILVVVVVVVVVEEEEVNDGVLYDRQISYTQAHTYF